MDIIACKICDQIQRVPELAAGNEALCVRCHSVLVRRIPRSRSRTAALSLAALILYVPANYFPILKMEYMGVYSENTIWKGCVSLFQDGMWAVAAVVFVASILFPLLKLLGLFFLTISGSGGSPHMQHDRTKIFKLLIFIGPWAMLDVFLLAILVALVKLGKFATVLPGPGLAAFTCVVVLTILASGSFDPRMVWDPREEKS